MATTQDVIKGLTVISQYSPRGINAQVEAQHDIIYADPAVSREDVSEADATLLEQLGWHWDADGRCWACFT